MTAQRYQVRNAEGRIIAITTRSTPGLATPGHPTSTAPIAPPETWKGTLWEISDSIGVVGYTSNDGEPYSSPAVAGAVFRADNVDYVAMSHEWRKSLTARLIGELFECPKCNAVVEAAAACTLDGGQMCHACYKAALAAGYGGPQRAGKIESVIINGRSFKVDDIALTEGINWGGDILHEEASTFIPSKTVHDEVQIDDRTFDVSDTDQRAAYLAVKSGAVAPPEPSPAKPPCSYCGGSGCGISGFIACPECG